MGDSLDSHLGAYITLVYVILWIWGLLQSPADISQNRITPQQPRLY